MKPSTQNHDGLKKCARYPAHNGHQIALAGKDLGQWSVGKLGQVHGIAISEPPGNPGVSRGSG
jgi:hypothetical protein